MNDLIDSFDWLSVRKDEAYPVFTGATSNSKLPWPDDLKSSEAGQVNGFFRWESVEDSAKRLAMSLFLVSPESLKTRFEIPVKAQADVSLRRLQNFRLKEGEVFRWQFGEAKGESKVGSRGLITVKGLHVTNTPRVLMIHAGEDPG